MPRRATSLPLSLPPRPEGTAGYLWLYDAIRQQVAGGRLEPGCRLPSTRDLARQFGMSRGTAVTAFEMLLAEGYLESASGSGTRVSRALPGASRARRGSAANASVPRRLSAAARRVVPFRQHAAASSAAFRANQPALDLFPVAEWARVATRTLRGVTPSLLARGEPLGHGPLRSAIAEYLAISRGVVCDPDRVVVVSGTQEALAVIATVLVDPGDAVCIEDPGYGGATRVMETLGARVLPLAVDDEGARVPSARVRAALAYLTPAHQFPLAVSMTMVRRLQWLRWAAATGAVIFEDDYDCEFRYAGHPVSALQGLDRGGSVVFAGSFSKVLNPSLRLGYLVVPPDLVDPVSAVLSVMSRQASLLNQAVLARFMAEGHFARHLRRMRDVYAERHAALMDGARRWLAGRLDVRPVNAGLQTVGLLARGLDGVGVARRAAHHGVEVVPLGRYARTPLERDGVQMGFAAVSLPEMLAASSRWRASSTSRAPGHPATGRRHRPGRPRGGDSAHAGIASGVAYTPGGIAFLSPVAIPASAPHKADRRGHCEFLFDRRQRPHGFVRARGGHQHPVQVSSLPVCVREDVGQAPRRNQLLAL